MKMMIFTYLFGLVMAMMAGHEAAGTRGCYVACFAYIALGLLLQAINWED